jgi:hypothetical protein
MADEFAQQVGIGMDISVQNVQQGTERAAGRSRRQYVQKLRGKDEEAELKD